MWAKAFGKWLWTNWQSLLFTSGFQDERQIKRTAVMSLTLLLGIIPWISIEVSVWRWERNVPTSIQKNIADVLKSKTRHNEIALICCPPFIINYDYSLKISCIYIHSLTRTCYKGMSQRGTTTANLVTWMWKIRSTLTRPSGGILRASEAICTLSGLQNWNHNWSQPRSCVLLGQLRPWGCKPNQLRPA